MLESLAFFKNDHLLGIIGALKNLRGHMGNFWEYAKQNKNRLFQAGEYSRLNKKKARQDLKKHMKAKKLSELKKGLTASCSKVILRKKRSEA